jgi:hypothetical protein
MMPYDDSIVISEVDERLSVKVISPETGRQFGPMASKTPRKDLP